MSDVSQLEVTLNETSQHFLEILRSGTDFVLETAPVIFSQIILMQYVHTLFLGIIVGILGIICYKLYRFTKKEYINSPEDKQFAIVGLWIVFSLTLIMLTFALLDESYCSVKAYFAPELYLLDYFLDKS